MAKLLTIQKVTSSKLLGKILAQDHGLHSGVRLIRRLAAAG